jgi:hypothetical protein
MSNIPNQQDKRFSSIFETAKNRLKEVEESKKQVVKDTAKKLEELGMPKEMISSAMTKELEGYVSRQYINAILGEEYKQEKELKKKLTVNNATSSEDEDKKVIEVSNTG